MFEKRFRKKKSLKNMSARQTFPRLDKLTQSVGQIFENGQRPTLHVEDLQGTTDVHFRHTHVTGQTLILVTHTSIKICNSINIIV